MDDDRLCFLAKSFFSSLRFENIHSFIRHSLWDGGIIENMCMM